MPAGLQAPRNEALRTDGQRADTRDPAPPDAVTPAVRDAPEGTETKSRGERWELGNSRGTGHEKCLLGKVQAEESLPIA